MEQHTLMACAARTEKAGRCRNAAANNPEGLCAMHAALHAVGMIVELAINPDIVLLKANVNPRWTAKFKALGVRFLEADFQKREQKHVADAGRVGREAYAIRKNIADSGVPIFGKKGLLGGTIVVEPLDALRTEYRLTDAHMFQRRDMEDMNVLVLPFERGLEGTSMPLPMEIAEFFAISCWGFAHIWTNPPREQDNKVLQTVNLSHRSDDDNAVVAQSLEFAKGLWLPKAWVA